MTQFEAARELIISSSILIIARNEHEWTSEGFSTAKRHHLAFFKFKSTDFNLLSSLVSFVGQNGRFCYDWSDSPVNHNRVRPEKNICESSQFRPFVNKKQYTPHIFNYLDFTKFAYSVFQLQFSTKEKRHFIYIVFFFFLLSLSGHCCDKWLSFKVAKLYFLGKIVILGYYITLIIKKINRKKT